MKSILHSRRKFMLHSAVLGAAGFAPASLFGQAPAIITSDRMRPAVTQGLSIGDVIADRAIVWSRSDRPARLWVEWSLSESFKDSNRVRGPLALDVSEYEKAPEKQNTAPSANLQFYGVVRIAGATAAMTVDLKDLTGATLYTKVLEPKRA